MKQLCLATNLRIIHIWHLLKGCMLSMHRLHQVVATLRPGIPYAFCIGSVVFSLLTATNLVTGAAPSTIDFAVQAVRWVGTAVCDCVRTANPCLLKFAHVLMRASNFNFKVLQLVSLVFK